MTGRGAGEGASLAPANEPFFRWSRTSPAARVMAALEAARPGGSRFVGGCVRDSLLHLTPKDIDIATVLTPADVIDVLGLAGIRVAPTGVEHGGVTAIANGVGVEVTTLRADVSTDGRRAVVAFTEDWTTDASRRDFTLNAIYLSADGRLFDPVGGAADARAGRVIFIGDPATRIREDYLRILRFFRFSARFAPAPDAAGLAACAALRAGMAALSAERIGAELMRILELPRAAEALAAMAHAGVLEALWRGAPPGEADIASVARLKALHPDAPAALGLAALYGGAGRDVERGLRLSNAVAERRLAAASNAAGLSPDQDEGALCRALYRIGVSAWADAVDLAAARDPAATNDAAAWARLRELPDRWTPPVFPVSGDDAQALGLAEGPALGAALAAAEAAWIKEGFPARDRALALLAAHSRR